MVVQHHAAEDLEQLFQMLEDPERDDRYTVAWIDCLARGQHLGRGIGMYGHHATLEELSRDFKNVFAIRPGRSRALPFDFPKWALNPLSIGAFNALYFHHEGKKQQPFLSAYDPYFYPLDSIGQWNRMYGKCGFLQYQCVIPYATAFEGIKSLLLELSASRRSSFLAVLKRLGTQGDGMLSFPMAGYTLALDLQNSDTGLFDLLNRLDAIVLQHGGRIYLAKDVRLSPGHFRSMYPRYSEWLQVENSVAPQNRFSSSLSRRMGMGQA